MKKNEYLLMLNGDIERIGQHNTAQGSQELYEEVCAKYHDDYPDLSNGLPNYAKVISFNSPTSYLTELKFIKNKFESYLRADLFPDYVTNDKLSAAIEKIDDPFLFHAADVLGETNKGLSGAQIVQYCNAYAVKFNVDIPITSSNFGEFGSIVSNKRTALLKNLQQFNAVQQFLIIKELCDLPMFWDNESVKQLRIMLFARYANLSIEKITSSELVAKTKHWLEKYPTSLEQYSNALSKYEGGIFERNTLDDMRLSFELLVKALLSNNKSLENNIADIGGKLKECDASAELRNMCTQIIKYYTDFQNKHVKHNDTVNENEIEYVIELTSVLMKFLIRTIGEQQ